MIVVSYFIYGSVNRVVYPSYTTEKYIIPANNLSFPAITFCNINQYNRSFVRKHPEVFAYLYTLNPKSFYYVDTTDIGLVSINF